MVQSVQISTPIEAMLAQWKDQLPFDRSIEGRGIFLFEVPEK